MSGEERAITIDCLGDELVGVLHSASERGACSAIFVVGGPQYRVGSHRMFVSIARALADSGTCSLRFDCRGMGDSDGEFVSFEAIDSEIKCSVDRMIELFPDRRVVLIGLCDGASACAMYAASDPRVAGLVLLNPWVRTDQGEAKARVAHYYVGRLRQLEFWRGLVGGEVDLYASMASFVHNAATAVFGRKADRGSFADRMLAGLSNFAGSTGIVLSGDDLVAQEFSMLIRTSAPWGECIRRSLASIHRIDDADHTFSGEGQLERAIVAVRQVIAKCAG